MPCYVAYGLILDCSFQLEFLPDIPGSTECDATIRYGPTPPATHLTSSGLKYARFDDGVVIQFDGLGSYLIRGGKEIIISPADQDNPHLCTIPLFGLVFAMLLEQRGYYVLHASSVAVNNRALIFLGAKQAGKSTLAAHFHFQGHDLISDDVASLTLCPTECTIHSGPAHLRLWPSALDNLNMHYEKLARVHPQIEKRYLDVNRSTKSKFPVAAIFLLRKGARIELKKLSSYESCLALLKYKSGAALQKKLPAHLAQITLQHCSQLAVSVPIYQLTRPEDLTLLDSVYTEICKAIH